MKINRRLVGIVASVAVAALVVAGLFAVGSPATARKFKADQRRVEQLEELHRALVRHFADEGELPDSLRALNNTVFESYGGVDPRFDPETGKTFEYRKVSDREYEVCARFDTSSDDPRNPNQSLRGYRPVPPEGFLAGGFFEYKAGKNCFKRTLTNSEIRNLYPEKFPVPGAVNVPEPIVSPAPSVTGNLRD
jgi:hypothetical protein